MKELSLLMYTVFCSFPAPPPEATNLAVRKELSDDGTRWDLSLSWDYQDKNNYNCGCYETAVTLHCDNTEITHVCHNYYA